MAEEFLKCGGVQALLQLKHISVAANGIVPLLALDALATIILRQCIDSERSVLQSAFKQTIKAACNGQPISIYEVKSHEEAMLTKRYHKDFKHVMLMLTPLVFRSPAVFVDAINNCVKIEQNEIQLKEQEDTGTNGAAPVLGQMLDTILNGIIKELANFDTLHDKKDRLKQPSNHLKLMAEILRSYPSIAVPAFIKKKLANESVLRWIIERFLLSAAASEECANEIGSSTTSVAEKNNPSTKFADKVRVLATLTMPLLKIKKCYLSFRSMKDRAFTRKMRVLVQVLRVLVIISQSSRVILQAPKMRTELRTKLSAIVEVDTPSIERQLQMSLWTSSKIMPLAKKTSVLSPVQC